MRILVLNLFVAISCARTIDVKLTAPWPTTAISPILETSEFLEEEGKFWEFVAALKREETISLLDEVESKPYNETLHEQVASLAVDVASEYISPLQLAALRLTLSVRSFAPLIETHRSLAELSAHACDSNKLSSTWAIVHPSGRVVCDVKDLEESLSSENEWENVVSDPTEHITTKEDNLNHFHKDVSTTSSSPSPTITLYSRLGTSSFWNFHDAILSLISKGKVSKFSYRHGTPKPTSTISTALQGYGINLDIKNMEYMNMDDSHESGRSGGEEGEKESEIAAAKEVSFEEDENINGFIFSKLLSRKPELGQELSKLRDEFVDEIDSKENGADDGQMKVWKMKDLGIQATHSIMHDKDPLRRLKTVSQNFPIYANELSRIRVDKNMKEEVKRIANSGLINLLGSGGGAQLFVNGRSVNIGLSTFNLFSLIDTIRSETRQLSKLSQLNLPPKTSSQLLEIGIKGGNTGGGQPGGGGVGGGGSQVRIDIVSNSKGAISFLNNLEKDAEYKRWGKNLRQLLMPSWSLITIARNLYTLIMVIDPTTEEGLSAVGAMYSLYQQMYPVRFGVILTSSSLLNEFSESEAIVLDRSIATTADAAKGEDVTDVDLFNDFRKANAADVSILFSQAKQTQSTSAAFKFLLSLSELSAGYSVDDMISCYVGVVAEASGSWTTSGLREEAIQTLMTAYRLNVESDKASTNTDLQLNNPSKGVLHENGFEGLLNMTKFASSKGLTVNSFTLNGIPSDSLDFQTALMPLLGKEQQNIQMMVHDGRLGDGNKRGSRGGSEGGDKALSDKSAAGKVKSVLSVLMAEHKAVPRYHSFVNEAPQDMKFLLPTPSLLNSLSYLHTDGSRDASMKSVSLILVDDWSKRGGMKRLVAALTFLTSEAASSQRARLSLLFSPESVETKGESFTEEGGSTTAGSEMKTAHDAAVALQTVINTIASTEDDGAIHFLLNLLKSPSKENLYDPSVVFNADLVENALKTSGLPDDTRLMLKNVLESCTSQETAVSNEEEAEAVAMILKELDTTRDAFGAVLVANGRSLFFESNEVFTAEDWKLLSDFEFERCLDVTNIIQDTDYVEQVTDSSVTSSTASSCVECDWRSNAVFVSAAFVGQYTQVARMDISEILDVVRGEHTLLDLSKAPSNNHASDESHSVGTVSIVVIVDPLTEAAQRVSPLLLVLRDELKLPLKVLFIPEPSLSEFPLSKFYRYVVGTDVGNLVPKALFEDLPRKHVLTMRMDVPEPWNVQSSKAIQDVDNLKCDDKLCGDFAATTPSSSMANDHELTQVEYTLKSLLLAGQCFDPVERRPPNGLQLTLKRLSRDIPTPTNNSDTTTVKDHSKNSDTTTSKDIKSLAVSDGKQSLASSGGADTVVMQNLGYYQLQASPGIFRLSLAEGRGKDLYYIIDQHDNVSSSTESKIVSITSFHDNNIPLRVKKQAGKEKMALLEDKANEENAEEGGEAKGGGLFSSFGSMFGGKVSSTAPTVSDDDTIHVFSLATGHLYERFLKIMMLSVVKRSSMHVKFWLFENYLSPTFKDSAIAMSKEYGFELGFVSYKWPSWLRQQTSKQRIIWGYKILFLDVLFPLNVKKVIYVDSDQTVRGDLAELWKMDLEGKPYAYTPFCSSRKETLGYQFWRQGYWKDHLKGKPYHISALYVVDLDVFRRTAVGDQLRALYDNLSRDPNSLSNLDQDLPNYAQYMIPIFSLPQEWLWCESWCSDKTKSAAKTIDLCNNPMHKEPKLDMAKRVISGKLFPESWVELDEEIKALEAKHRIGSQSHEAEEASLDMGFG